MKQKQPTPLSLLFYANKENLLSTLTIWLRLKAIHKHTIYYNFRYENISDLMGISHTCLRKHIKIMTSLGWCSIKNNHLHLTGINKLKSVKDKNCVLIKVKNNKKEQIDEFRQAIIANNIFNQEKAISRNYEIVKKAKTEYGKLSKKDLKRVMKKGGLLEFESKINGNTTLSNNKIGNLFGLSKYSGSRIQRTLKSKKLINSKINIKLVASNVNIYDFYFNYNFGGYIYNKLSKTLYLRHSNTITIPSYSI